MKFTSLAYLLAAAAMGSAAVLAPAPAPRAPSADGLYIETTDAAGNTKVDFTPHHEVVNSTAFHTADVLQRSAVEKRREGCHASARVPSSVTDEANRLLLAQYPTSQVRIDGRARASYVYQNARSFICAYSAGWKDKSSISGTWSWVKYTKCGIDRLGYGQVLDGSGDWTAGYTYDGDGYCW